MHTKTNFAPSRSSTESINLSNDFNPNQLRDIKSELIDELNHAQNRYESVTKSRNIRLGDILIELGQLNELQLKTMLNKQAEFKAQHKLLGQLCIEEGLINDSILSQALKIQHDHKKNEYRDSILDKRLTALFEPDSDETENYQRILIALNEWLQTHKYPITTLSLDSGDGRSLFTANLAVSFSLAQKRVLLIDADFRNPILHKLFAINNDCGLAGYLNGQNANKIFHEIDSIPNLTIVPTGVIPQTPELLLNSPTLRLLLQKAIETYDVVLIDTPAVNRHSDAELLASISKSTIILARKNHTQMKQLTKLNKRLKNVNVLIPATILNCK